jgi:hypothetical protein
MSDPYQELERIARGLDIPLDDTSKDRISEFASDFLDANLRHNFFDASDFELNLDLPPLTREAYLWLRWLATERTTTDSPQFWEAWERSRKAVQRLIASRRSV